MQLMNLCASHFTPRNGSLTLWLLMFCWCTPLVWAEEANIAEQQRSSASELVARLTPLHALTGNFEQRQIDSEGELLSQSQGSFKMQRPGLLHWETIEPFPQLLVTDGARIWMYDPDLEQVTVSEVTAQLSNTPAVIFSGDLQQLQEQYTVTSPKEHQYRLRPLSDDTNFQRLDLTFAEGLLTNMVILDTFGQLTQFELRNVTPVESMPAAQFQFSPPAGTDVFFNE